MSLRSLQFSILRPIFFWTKKKRKLLRMRFKWAQNLLRKKTSRLTTNTGIFGVFLNICWRNKHCDSLRCSNLSARILPQSSIQRDGCIYLLFLSISYYLSKKNGPVLRAMKPFSHIAANILEMIFWKPSKSINWRAGDEALNERERLRMFKGL